MKFFQSITALTLVTHTFASDEKTDTNGSLRGRMGVDNEVVAFNTTQMPKERFLSGVEEKTIEDGYGSFTSISLGSIYWQDWQAFNNN